MRRWVAVVVLASGSACHRGRSSPALGGNPERGREAIASVGCGSCHTIEGVFGATATAAPNLTGIASRTFLAGRLVNTPDNMLRWIMRPDSIEPGVDMPPFAGAGERTARDMVAYLATLR